MADEQRVGDDMVVSMDYTLRLDDGQVIDSSEGREPLEFIQGQGQIIPGLEQELYDMGVGDEKEVTVAPAAGYGERQDGNIQIVPREAFPPTQELEVGMGVQMQDPNSGQVFQGTVAQVTPDTAVVDFNHPLAGQTLHFDVSIAGLRPATDEEIEHGHVHGPEGH